jgi:hypothetical protein
MRSRYGSHGTCDLVTIGETELRLDEPEVFWSLSARHARGLKDVPTLEQGTAKSSRETGYLIWFTIHG